MVGNSNTAMIILLVTSARKELGMYNRLQYWGKREVLIFLRVLFFEWIEATARPADCNATTVGHAKVKHDGSKRW